MFEPDWAAALREFDEREREITNALAHFAARTDREGKRVYRQLQRDYGREMAQISVRRRMIAPYVQDISRANVGQRESEATKDTPKARRNRTK